MEKLKRERGSPWLRENEKISRRVEAGVGRPACGGWCRKADVWRRHVEVWSSERRGGSWIEEKKRKNWEKKLAKGAAELKKRKGKNKRGEGYFRIYLML